MSTEADVQTEFKYTELSPKAQEKARDHYRSRGYSWDEWWEPVYEDMVRVCELFGIETNYRMLRFSGFWSQGDGASFSGRYDFEGLVLEKIKAHAPQDEELHALAVRLDDWNVVRRAASVLAGEDDDLGWVGIGKNSSYAHSATMYLTDVLGLDDEQEKDLLAIFRDLADWHYRQLEAEHEHLTSDEEIGTILTENEDDRYDEDGDII